MHRVRPCMSRARRPRKLEGPTATRFSRWSWSGFWGMHWLGPPAIGAPSHPFFGWEGSPTKIDYRKKRYPCSNLSNLEDLVGHQVCGIIRGSFGVLPHEVPPRGGSGARPSRWRLCGQNFIVFRFGGSFTLRDCRLLCLGLCPLAAWRIEPFVALRFSGLGCSGLPAPPEFSGSSTALWLSLFFVPFGLGMSLRVLAAVGLASASPLVSVAFSAWACA